MVGELREIPGTRRTSTTAGQGWAGKKYVRIFNASERDADYAMDNDLSLGTVLPVKWGGVSTSRAVDPRLVVCVNRGQKGAAGQEIYTEWDQITTISGFVADFWTPYEASSSGGRVGSTDRFYGERLCIILNSEIGPLAPNYNVALGANHPFPGSTGPLAAQLRRYHLAPMAERPLCSRLTMYYTEPTPVEMLEPGRAVLMVELASRETKLTSIGTGLDRVTIDGEGATGFEKWVYVSGNRIELVPGARVGIKTASLTPSVPNMWDKVGCVNQNTFTNIGGAPAGTMMYHGAKLTGELLRRRYYSLIHEFEYHPLVDGKPYWFSDIYRQKMKKYPLTRPVMTYSGGAVVADGSKETTVVGWWPDGNPVAATREKREASFSDIDSALAWY